MNNGEHTPERTRRGLLLTNLIMLLWPWILGLIGVVAWYLEKIF